MNLDRFCLKFFAQPNTRVDDAEFIDIFHEWIRLKKLGGILLDVADYRHVPTGPGVMLITHDINFALDYAEGQFGLFAQRKSGSGHTHQDRILELVRATVAFGLLLETDPRLAGGLRFEAGSFNYMSNDRLQAPNTQAAFEVLNPDIEAAANIIYPAQDVFLARAQNDPRERLAVQVDSGTTLEMAVLANSVGVVA